MPPRSSRRRMRYLPSSSPFWRTLFRPDRARGPTSSVYCRAMAHLIAIGGPLTGMVWPLVGPTQTLGREPSAQLYVPDEAISRMHCRLDQADDEWTFVDLGSTNAS